MQTLIIPAINFFVLVGLLVYFLRRPVRDYVTGRHAQLRDEVAEVRTLLERSQQQFDQFSGKLRAMDAEVSALRAQSETSAREMAARVTAEAERLSKTLVADAKVAASSMSDDLRKELRTELASRVVTQAESLLTARLTGDDRIRIRKEFSSELERAQ